MNPTATAPGRFRLATRLVLSFGLLIAAILAVGLVALNETGRAGARFQQLFADRVPKVDLARSALRISNLNNRLVLEVFLLDDPAAIRNVLSERSRNSERITEIYREISARISSPEERKLFDAIAATREPYVKSYLKAFALLLDEKDRERAHRVVIAETLPKIRAYHAAVQAFVEFEGDQMQREATLTNRETAAARRTIALLLWAAGLIALAIGLVTSASIVSEVRKRRLAEDRLLASHDALEGRIFERTVELAHANEALRIDAGRREEAQRALAESESLLARSQEIAHLGSWTSEIPDDGRLVWSKETFRIFGVAKEGFDGRVSSFFDRIHPDDLEAVRLASARATSGDEPYSIDHRILRPDGSVRWVHEEATLVRDGSGAPVRMIGTVQDITERRRLEEQFGQAQKMEAVGRLAGGVAHDFNNLLTVVSGYAELLEARLGRGSPLLADVEQIRRAADRAAELTRQLLAFGRKQTLEPRVLDLNATLSGVEKMLRRLIGEDVAVVTRLGDALGRVKADPGQLEQVLVNLAVNARDAMPAGGTLAFETENVTLDAAFVAGHPGARAGDYVALTVADSGTGMTEEVQSHLFEPFYTTKEKGKGSGLGLATVYGIVKQSDGYITAESRPGAGTTFRIFLPRVFEPVQSDPRREVSPAQPGGTETVLLVEDEEGVRRLARTILEENGYRVLEAASGPEALDVATTHRGGIHLVATDVVMPGMSGPELARRLAGTLPSARVLFISGYADDAIAHHGVLKAGTPFLQKPFTPAAFLRKVRGLLDAPRACG